jgi:DNA mismatch repair protein MutS2
MRVQAEVLQRLEWGRVLEMLAERTRTPMGGGLARRLHPAGDPDEVRRRQARAAEMRRALAEGGRLPIAAVEDPQRALEELQIARKTLQARGIYETVRLLVVARELSGRLRELDPEVYPTLGSEWARLPDLRGVIDAIHGNITASGHVEDQASPELARIRRQIRHLSERLTETLEGLIRAEWTGPVLRDRYITVRNQRYVLPVRTDSPRRFHGIVHGTSASEKTLFVEPIETVEINNQLVGLMDEEEQEVERILSGYTEMLRAYRDDIRVTARVLGELDLLEAVAAWADEEHGCTPSVVEDGGLRMVAARHPGLERSLALEVPPRELVPLDVDFPRELRVLVISGPNAGGKTVALKTIGLLTLMVHAGLPVPAEEAQVPFFGTVLADIGDEQSIEGGLSTFSSHVRNLAEMIRQVEAPALSLIDEIGTGTDPAEGAALGTAILDRLLQHGAHVVATTHHQAIKTWAYRTERALNAACEFDEQTLRPTYRLVPGVAGASIGLTMARQLGLDAQVVEDAEARLDPAGAEMARALESVRSLASDLQRARSEAVERRRELDRELERARVKAGKREQQRDEEWQRRVQELLTSFRKEAERLLRQVQDVGQRRAMEKERARRERELKERFSEELRVGRDHEPAPSGWQPQVGDTVYVASLGRQGRVTRVDDDAAEVMLGRARFSVAASDLRPVAAEAGGGKRSDAGTGPESGRRRPPTPSGVHAELADREVPTELHLLGMRVDEALRALEKYLDDAGLAGLPEVRIVHGIGTGRLRQAVREQLEAHPEIVRWREAHPNEGGAGATVVVLEER